MESIETFQKRGALEEFEFRQIETTYEYLDKRLEAHAACFYNPSTEKPQRKLATC